MNKLPVETKLDSTLAVARDPYRFISSRCEKLKTDAFESRLLLSLNFLSHQKTYGNRSPYFQVCALI